MSAKFLDISGLRQHEGATVTYFRTKTDALTALKDRNLGPDVRPERVENRFFRFWMIAAAPVGDPGEGRVLLTAEGGWVILCAIGCIHVRPGHSYCPGHPMTIEESAEFTLALCGHRTEIYSIGTTCRVEGIDWSNLRPFVDHIPTGSLYRARCLCGWRSGLAEERRHAGWDARQHESVA